jgi:hypothetical protein
VWSAYSNLGLSMSTTSVYQENIFLDSTFRCQISGFELARDSAPTTSSMLNFVAPELFIRSDKCDHSDLDMCYEHHNMRERKTVQTDVYAFGCLYYAVRVYLLSNVLKFTLTLTRPDIFRCHAISGNRAKRNPPICH